MDRESQANAEMPLLRNGAFLRVWAAQAISVLGTELTLIAFPLIAVAISASPLEIALISVVGLLPFLVLGLPAGVLVERVRRRPLMIAMDLIRAAVLASVPLAAWLGVLGLGQLFIAAAVVGTCRLFFDVADTSFLPRIVHRTQLVDANSKLYLTLSSGQIAGPAAAGVIIALVSAPGAIIADVVSYLGSAALLSRVQRAEPQPRAEKGLRWRAELGEGLRHVFGDELLRPTTITAGIYNAAEGGIRALLVAYMVTSLDLSPAVTGLTIGVGAIGFPIGSLLAGRLNQRFGVGPTSFWAAVAGTAGPVLIPLAPAGPGGVAVLIAASFITALGPSIYGINYVSMRQAITPDRLQARMNATTRFVVWGAMPIGALLAGLIGDVFGIRAALAAMAALGLLCLPVLWLSPFRRLKSLPTMPSAKLAV